MLRHSTRTDAEALESIWKSGLLKQLVKNKERQRPHASAFQLSSSC
jgi:hypothetical protein